MFHPYQYEELAKEYRRERLKEAETWRISVPKRSIGFVWRDLLKRIKSFRVSLINAFSVYGKRLSRASWVN